MMNRKNRFKAAIACAAAVLAVLIGTLSIQPTAARAEALPKETIGIARLSGIRDGYDASLSGIGYEIVIPAP